MEVCSEMRVGIEITTGGGEKMCRHEGEDWDKVVTSTPLYESTANAQSAGCVTI